MQGLFKGAAKSYFMHYSCVVIVLFNTALCRSAFSMVPFRKLVFFVFLCFLWIKTLKYASSYYVILVCNFVLTLKKKLTFYKKKLFIEFLHYWCKNMLSEMFWAFQNKEKEFYKEKCGTVKNIKSVKKVIIKKVSYESFSCMYKYSIRYFLELRISICCVIETNKNF